MKRSEKPIWTVGQVLKRSWPPEKNCQMFDLLPNNQANQSEAETRHRARCTGTVGSKVPVGAETRPEGRLKKG